MQILDKVKFYNSDIPKAKMGWNGVRWAQLLFWDFIFNFSKDKDADGNLVKRIESNTSINKKFKKVHDKCVDTLIKNNPEPYDTPFKIPEIEAEDFTRDFFKYWKKSIKTPIVVKNFLKGAEILDYATKESLVNNEGDREIQTLSNTIEIKNKVGQNIDMRNALLKDFLTNPEYQDSYISGFNGVLKDEDFKIKCKGDKLDHIQNQKSVLNQWFISRSNKTGTSLHCAAADNMFLNIKGQKEWHFIDPSYSSVLQTRVSKYGLFAISEVKEKINDGHASLIEGNEYLKHVPFYRTVLEEGDLLYNPPLFWHAVKNVTDYNVGCATRYYSHSNKSLAIQSCMIAAIFKHPTKNQFTDGLKALINKRKKEYYINSQFSAKKSESKDRLAS